jgi:hypothetical protein
MYTPLIILNYSNVGDLMDPEKILVTKTLEEKDQKIREQDFYIKKTKEKLSEWQDNYKQLEVLHRSKEGMIYKYVSSLKKNNYILSSLPN